MRSAKSEIALKLCLFLVKFLSMPGLSFAKENLDESLFRCSIYFLFVSIFFSRSVLVAGSILVLVSGTWWVARRHRHELTRDPLFVPLLAFFGVIILSIILAKPYPFL